MAPLDAPVRVVCEAALRGADAQRLVERHGATLVAATDLEPEQFYLALTADHLELRRAGHRGGVWVPVDEIRRRKGAGASELGRACRVRPGMQVLDALAGFGIDGLTLAQKGKVTLVERSPWLVPLLHDLVERCSPGRHVRIVHDDVMHLLAREQFDVVYLDPMFPERSKSALPSKRLQFLRALLEAESVEDTGVLTDLVAASRHAARARVVLKRRRNDAEIGAPSWQIHGRSVRFDVYRPAAATSSR